MRRSKRAREPSSSIQVGFCDRSMMLGYRAARSSRETLREVDGGMWCLLEIEGWLSADDDGVQEDYPQYSIKTAGKPRRRESKPSGCTAWTLGLLEHSQKGQW